MTPTTRKRILTLEERTTLNRELNAKTELQTIRRIITKVHPAGIVSVVADTWNLWDFINSIIAELKPEIMARPAIGVMPGRTVVRPDSSPKTPVEIICGDLDAEPGSPEFKGVVELLWDIFGGTVNSKGFKQLDDHIGVIYGDAISLEVQWKILDGLKKKGFASTNVVLGIGSYCVSPETPILCADLIWRKAGEIEVGQEIIAFEEDPALGQGKYAARHYVKATIVVNNPGKKVCSKIYTDIGDPITASDDHPWLVWSQNRKPEEIFIGDVTTENTPRSAGLAWRKTSELQVGDQIAFFGKPWEIEDSRDGGWLSGIYDGEGCVSKSTGDDRNPAWKVNFSQNRGPILDKVRTMLTDRGYTFYEQDRNCPQIVNNGGWTETLRFLGSVRPERLLSKLPEVLERMPMLLRDSTFQLATIEKVEECGEQAVASIQTSCGTFITGGYLSHNTYQMVSRDTQGQALKETLVKKDGRWIPTFKDPVTDTSGKKSAKGGLSVHLGSDNEYYLAEHPDLESAQKAEGNILQPVWTDGQFKTIVSFADVRKTAEKHRSRI